LIDEGNVSFAFEMLSRGQESFLTVNDLVGVFSNDMKSSDIEKAYCGAGYSLKDKLDYDDFKRMIFDDFDPGNDDHIGSSLRKLSVCVTSRSDWTEETPRKFFSRKPR
jgi:hypothetical protein